MSKVIIIGGGVAGLCSAIALIRQGFEVKVYERSPEPTEAGAGIIIAPNALQALEKINMATPIMQAGLGNDGICLMSDKGRKISKLVVPHGSYKMYSIHRKDLNAILYSALPDATVEYGKECVFTEQNKHEVKAIFSDGSEDSGSLLIAADGIHSPVRNQLNTQHRYRFSGYTCWRTVISTETISNLSGEFIETWGTKGRVGIVPLPHQKAYLYVMINSEENDPEFAQYTVDSLVRRFEKYHQPIPKLLKLIKPKQMIHRDILDIVPMQCFYSNRIAFIGDAAHAFTPNLGQGACQAIEDAILLAQSISDHNHYQDAFAAFDASRRKRIEWISNQSWTLGKMAQFDHPLMAMFRNTFMKYTPKSLYQKQFHDLYKFS